MLLAVAILLGSVYPTFLIKVVGTDRNLMEGRLQKYVEDFMAYYGNSTGLRQVRPPQRIRTVFGINQGKNNQKNEPRKEKVTPSSIDGNRNRKELFNKRQKKRRAQKKKQKTRTKSQNKGQAYTHPHGHAYEFDGTFDPFPLWRYSGR